MPTLQAELDLELEAALSRLGELDDALQRSATSFADSLDLALGTASTSVAPIEDALQQSASGFADSLSTAFELAAQQAGDLSIPVAVEADTSEIPPALEGAIEEGIGGADRSVQLEGVTGEEAITDAIDQAIADADTTVAVDADTSEAQDSIDQLGESAKGAQEGTDSLASSTGLLGGAMGVASAGASELQGGIGGLTHHALEGAGAAVGLGIGIHEIIEGGIEATSALQRFNTIVGDFRENVEHVRVGNLNTDLKELGIQFGSTEAEMQNASSSLFQFATNSGAAGDDAAEFTSQVNALAARAVALKPALGDVADVADSMGVRIARGGRFAANFGLSLTSAEINARALANTGKETASDLTIYEKAAAAAQIATERYGGSLKETVAAGAKNAANEQKSLTATLKEAIEQIGKPLVVPFFEAIRAGIPLAEALGQLLAILAQSALPSLTLAAQALAAPLQIIADVLGLIPGPVLEIVAAFFVLQKVLALTGGAFTKLGAAGIGGALKGTLGTVGAAAGLAAISFQQIGTSTEGTIGGILGMTAAGAALGSVIPGVGTGIGAAAGAVVGLGTALFKGGESVDDYRAKFAKLGTELESFTKKQAVEKFLKSLGQSDQFALFTGNVRGVTDEIKALASASPAAAERVVRGLKDMVEAGDLHIPRKELALLDEALESGTKKFQQSNAAKREAQRENDKLAGSGDQVTTSLQEQQAAQEAATKALDDFVGKASGALPTLSGLFDTVAQSAGASVDAILSQLPSVGSAFDSAEQAAQSFGQHITPELLLSGLRGSIDQITAFTDNVQTLLDAGLGNVAKLLLDKGPQVGGQLAQSLADGVRDGRPELAQELDTTAAQLEQAGKDAATRFGGAFSPEALLKSFQESLVGITEFTQNVQTIIDAGLTDLASVIIEKGPEAGGALAKTLADGLRNGQPDIANELNETAGRFRLAGSAYANIVQTEWGPAILNAQNNSLRLLGPAAERELKGVTGAIEQQGQLAEAQARLAGIGIDVNLTDGMSPLPGHAQGLMVDAEGNIRDAQGNLANAGEVSGSRAAGGFGTGIGGIPGLASSAAAGAGPALSEQGDLLGRAGGPAFGAGFQVGESFGLGVLAGIASTDEKIQSQAATIIDNAETAARLEARGHSPSRLMMALGRDMGLGLALGIAQAEGDVTAASKRLVTAAAAAAAPSSDARVLALPSSARAPSVAQPASGLTLTSGAPLIGGDFITNVQAPVDNPRKFTQEQARALRTESHLAGWG